jgi:uncharacterized protein with PIN domain
MVIDTSALIAILLNEAEKGGDFALTDIPFALSA